ncbi:hypothetical protein B7C51_15640 [Paenibacillus larvae subsp. pulvifaciens]|uniref:Antirepressor protein C-terminal domain-containing protein n=1 Tax=Paenibacillus larvae subsp. pulvifaciens TaxID=1477 RepID=A0A1V0UV41_9BACL|nr:hypothetical protein [Paenibacillus larvae]ARF68922.1 hypothetical protein B7C51_15640 [Paenibacillus larvae subsp. pulvifaciens]
MINSSALIESKTLRESVIDRTEVLEKVKKLSMLPDDMNASIEIAATYYEVSRKAINSLILDHREELENDGLRVLTGNELISLKEMGVIGKNAAAFTIIPRRAVLRIGMLLRDSPVARSVRDHLLNVEAERKPNYDDPGLLHFKKEAYMIEVAANVLRLPDSGKLKLLHDFNKQHCLQVPLPAYADEQVTESATVLLKKHKIPIGAAKFNTLLIQHGLLEEKERPSRKGKIKLFKSLTDKGLEYGKNIVSPHSPRETAPHYFANKFPELIEQVGL